MPLDSSSVEAWKAALAFLSVRTRSWPRSKSPTLPLRVGDELKSPQRIRVFLKGVYAEVLSYPQVLFPIALWIFLFSQGEKMLPQESRPDVSTQLLPWIESFLGWPHRWFAPSNNSADTILPDVIAAFAYTIHVFVPVLFLISSWLSGFLREPSNATKFVFCFGLLNSVVVLTQFVFPVAPPWHFEKWGVGPHDRATLFAVKGDPSGLSRVDTYFGSTFYTSTYAKAPIVYGAFPSLHAAWPVLCAVFSFTHKRRWAGAYWTFHSAMVWWAALYLQHHYLTDLLGGFAYAYLSCRLGTRLYRYVVSLAESDDALRK